MKERDFYSLVSDYIALEKKYDKTWDIEDELKLKLKLKELRWQISQAIYDYEDSVMGNLFTERCIDV